MEYKTHWEFSGEIAMLVIREFMTSNFSVCKRLYFNTDDILIPAKVKPINK